MSILRPLILNRKYYYIPDLEVYFKGVKSVKIDFDEDQEGKYIKIRPYEALNVPSYILSDVI